MEQESLWGKFPCAVQGGAILHGVYRYTLWRTWDEQLPCALFILLNPSTADAEQDDPTLRRCLGFARREHCGSLEIVNLFAYRATQPGLLKTVPDPIGAENDQVISAAAQRASIVLCQIILPFCLKKREMARLWIQKCCRGFIFKHVSALPEGFQERFQKHGDKRIESRWES